MKGLNRNHSTVNITKLLQKNYRLDSIENVFESTNKIKVQNYETVAKNPETKVKSSHLLYRMISKIKLSRSCLNLWLNNSICRNK